MSAHPSEVQSPRNAEAAARGLSSHGSRLGSIHGAGRSYSDVGLPRLGAGALRTQGMAHVLSFDRERGEMVVEAGTTLRDIQTLALGADWCLPVMPGTAWATAGGALANDVHGKNHPRVGSFSRCVKSLTLARADRGVFELARDQADLWAATVGGLGATGVVLRLKLRLAPCATSWMAVSRVRFHGVGAALRLLRESHAEHAVGWVDTFAKPARGVMFFGHGASVSETRENGTAQGTGGLLSLLPLPRVPAINAWVSLVFNQAYWLAHAAGPERLVGWREFFCPLDALKGWNALYGKRGFSQFQCVVPEAQAEATYEEMFSLCRRAGQGSFLSVIKRFGSVPSEGVLSFTRPGISFAMDFPNVAAAPVLVASLARLALDAGGALYPAKMAFASLDQLDASFPNWRAWQRQWDPQWGACKTGWLDRLGIAAS